MATSPLFGWEEPDDTDLVKDGAAAIRTLGNAIDTSMGDLLGGTTGQILSKASNSNMDFTWITNDVGDITAVNVTSPITGGGTSGAVTIAIQDGTTAQKGAVQLENSTSSTSTTTAAVPASVKSAYDLANGAIPKSLVDAAGDLLIGTANDTVGRLAIGTNGQVLQSNGTTATWATPASAGGMTLLSTTTLSGTSTTISSISGSYTNLLIFVYGITGSTGGELRINGATTGLYAVKTFTEAGTAYTQSINNGMTRWNEGGAVSGNISVALLINNYASTASTKAILNTGGFMNSTTGYSFNQHGHYNSTSAVTSLTVTSDGASFTAGTVLIYGVK